MLISYLILLALTFVVRIQMQSILTHPNQQSFTKYSPFASLQLHLTTACCWRWHPSASCPPLSPPSHHLLSTPKLSPLPFSRSLYLCYRQRKKNNKNSTILWLLQVKCRLRSMATCLTRLHLPSRFLAVFFILWQLAATIVTSKTAWLRLCPHTRAESSWLTESERENSYMRRRAQKCIHMDAQAHVTQSHV